MGTIHPTEEQFTEIAAGPEGPIVMVNKLRYKRDADGQPVGFAAYEKYSEAVTPMVLGVGGKPVWVGRADSTFIGSGDDRWDTYLLVEYPSRQAFLSMVTSEAYLAVHHLREDALEDSVIVVTTPGEFV